jgi:hypothetical protein
VNILKPLMLKGTCTYQSRTWLLLLQEKFITWFFSAFVSMITEFLFFLNTRASVTFKWVHTCFCWITTSISKKSLKSSLYRLQQVSVALWKSFYRQFFTSRWTTTLQLWCHVYLCSFMFA